MTVEQNTPTQAQPARLRRALWIVVQLAAVLLAVLGTYLGFRRGAVTVSTPTIEPLPTFAVSAELQAQIVAAALGQASSYTCPRSLDMGPVEIATCTDCIHFPVDRLRALPASYAPKLVRTELAGGGLIRAEVKPQLAALFAAAQKAGHSPVITSAYRSYEEQVRTFSAWVSYEMNSQLQLTEGEATDRASRYSARPGHSEHQLGTVVDVNCAGCAAFNDSDARNRSLWKFFEETAHRYGFVISYPRGIEALTGYQYEPWHLRYLGVEYATQLFDAGYLTANGVCLLNFLRSVVNGIYP